MFICHRCIQPLLGLGLLGLLATGPVRAASDVTIVEAIKPDEVAGGTYSGSNPLIFTPTADSALALRLNILTAMFENRTVQFSTASSASGNGDLFLKTNLSKASPGTCRLSFSSDRDLVTEGYIYSSGGPLPLTFYAGRHMRNSQVLNSSGGDMSLTVEQLFEMNSDLAAGSGSILVNKGVLTSLTPRTLTASVVSFSVDSGLRFAGTVEGNLLMSGSMSPGAPLATKDLLVKGTLTLQTDSTTVIELASTTAPGASYDRVRSTKSVNLGGVLEVTLLQGFEDRVKNTDVFTIFEAPGFVGTFLGQPNLSRVTLANNLGSFRITYGSTKILLDDWQPAATTLVWDNGATMAGTQTRTMTGARAGRHFFRVSPQATATGLWRTRLTVTSGTAELYMARGELPTTSHFLHSATQSGNKAVLLHDQQYAADEEWHVMVYSSAGATWTLLSGDVHVENLGTLTYTDSNSNGQYDIGETTVTQSVFRTAPAEGLLFYKATVPTGAASWSLWLNGSLRDLAIREAKAPLHISFPFFTRKQAGRMLVTRPVLKEDSSTYFLSVAAPEGEAVTLNSRISQVTDIPLNSTQANVAVTGAPYSVFRVHVPADLPAWDISMTPVAGDPNLAVRKDYVPAENDNDAFSEVADATDSITLVPDKLTAGTWFITVYGAAAHTFTLNNTSTVATTLDFAGTQSNSLTNRVGGRFYALTNLASQEGSLGWKLELIGHEPGTQIAIRRNRMPGRWQSRSLGSVSVFDTQQLYVDEASSSGSMVRPGHVPDVWYVAVLLPGKKLGAFHLTTSPITPTALSFNNSTATLTNQAPGTWIFHEVTVPAGVLGWDIRVCNVTRGTPQLVVRRDRPAANYTTGPWTYPHIVTAWPPGYQWAAETDWTNRPHEKDSTVSTAPRRLVMAMGGPLEPGVYHVGVVNAHPTESAAYVLESRGIGDGQTFPVPAFSITQGNSVNVSNLPAREARYFKVTIPASTPSWEFGLTTTVGEMMLCARRRALPDFRARDEAEDIQAAVLNETRVQKAGPERYVMLPRDGQDFLQPGDYYLAVVSEGVAPPRPLETGTGNSSGTLVSRGPLAVTDLGSLTSTGFSQAISLESGQVKSYRFTVPVGTEDLELRLDNRTGNPTMGLVEGLRIASPNPRFAGNYGWSGGQRTGIASASGLGLITVPSPPAGTYHVTLNAAELDGEHPAATATLVIRPRTGLVLNFDSALNSNGSSHTDTRQLLNGQRMSYDVAVPLTLAGQPVIGWQLKTTTTEGAAVMRIYKKDLARETGIEVTGPLALITPPFLTPGETWRVEIEGHDLTSYTITSQQVSLNRAAWTMPTTPGSNIGDSGVVNLPLNTWHFYAVDVPAGNAGLLRTELQALAGDPDLYVREDGVPTPNHDQDGGLEAALPLIDRRLNQTGTEYGNWVPLNGRLETGLKPGRWYLAVKAAGNVAAQYRLLLSTGQVTSLNLAGGSAGAQFLAKGDWRYYRFTVPVTMPDTWSLNFTEAVGDVVMWLRDTVPPGDNNIGHETTDHANGLGLRSWRADAKNQGPYPALGYDAPDIHTFTPSIVRPGQVYYVGFRAKVDSSFSLSSSISAVTPAAPTVLDYYSGQIDISLPAGQSRLYQIQAPANATRLMWKTTHPSTAETRVEQGALPTVSGPQHWTSGTAANARFNQLLNPIGWPWRPASLYYVRIVNHGSTAAAVKLSMEGRDPSNADEDLDRLPDAWEKLYYANEHDATTTTDTDEDGLPNLTEFAFNLSPIVAGTPILTPGSGLSGLPYISYNAVSQRLRVEFVRRKYRYLAYNVQFTTEPATGWEDATQTAVVSTINAEWERVVVEDHSTAIPRFVRVVLRLLD